MGNFEITYVQVALSLALGAFVASRFKTERNPPGPKPLPVIGNLLDNPFINAREKHVKWREQHGDIVYFDIVGTRIIVLNSLQVCSDLLEKRSAKYSSRPRMVMFNELMGWDYSFIIMPYSARWRRYRRLFRQHFDESISLNYRPVQQRNAYRMLQNLLEDPDRLDDHLRVLFGGNTLEVVYGIKVEDLNNPFLMKAEQALSSARLPGIPGQYLVDGIPILKYVPSWFPGAEFKRQAAIWKEWALAARDMPFSYAKETMERGTAIPSMVASTLSDNNDGVLKDDSSLNESLEEITSSCAAAAYLAGADSSVSTMQAFFVAMANYPDAQKAAQAELDALLEGSRLPTFNDMEDLPFIQALVKELLRWHNVAPMAVAHMLTKDDEYNGYDLRKGTIILPNTWLILHDPEIYPEPMKFDPWRWLISTPQGLKINEAIPDPGLAAFGYGRRVCPGRYFGTNALTIATTCLLACFHIRPLDADGKPAERVEEAFTDGLVSYPVPFKVSITPRTERAKQLIKELSTEY